MSTLAERFWSKVNKTDTCWIWTGCRTKAGYGLLTFNRKNYYAHRVAWELQNGPIPKGMLVCHDCPGGDNPACVRHLFLGTHKDNSTDAVRKGRMKPQAETLRRMWRERGVELRGESHKGSKLTDSQVLELRRLHDSGEMGYKKLAKHFRIAFGVAQRIANRKSWTHLP
jgi:hypothetical protein